MNHLQQTLADTTARHSHRSSCSSYALLDSWVGRQHQQQRHQPLTWQPTSKEPAPATGKHNGQTQSLVLLRLPPLVSLWNRASTAAAMTPAAGWRSPSKENAQLTPATGKHNGQTQSLLLLRLQPLVSLWNRAPMAATPTPTSDVAITK
jgi:thiamine biosynthesis lipoprotein ApbE